MQRRFLGFKDMKDLQTHGNCAGRLHLRQCFLLSGKFLHKLAIKLYPTFPMFNRLLNTKQGVTYTVPCNTSHTLKPSIMLQISVNFTGIVLHLKFHQKALNNCKVDCFFVFRKTM